MIDVDVREQVERLLTAVRTRPQELPLAELSAVQAAGVRVEIARRDDETVVFVAPGRDDRLRLLTRRETEVATLAAAGFSNDQIAAALFVSVATVKDHMHSIFTRTGFTSRAQLIAAWYGGLASD